MKNNVILFLHGLEAGVNGNKARYLRENYDNFVCPDLEVSVFNIYKKNSFLRNFILNPIFIILLLLCFTFTLFIFRYLNPFYSLILIFLLFTVSVKIKMKDLLSYAVSKSLEKNISLATKMIEIHNPKIVIGSSWGGAVALNLIERGIWKGHTILLAPAYLKIKEIIMKSRDIHSFQLKNLLNYEGKIVVYHSLKDEIIPFEHSKYLCTTEEDLMNTFELRMLDSDSHKLDSLINGPSFVLKQDIDKLINIS